MRQVLRSLFRRLELPAGLELRSHLFVNPRGQSVRISLIGLVEIAVIASWHELAYGVAALLFKEAAEHLHGLVQPKRVSVAADHIYLAFELRREPGPVFFEYHWYVVFLSVFHDLLIELARLVIVLFYRSAVFAARTPDPLE